MTTSIGRGGVPGRRLDYLFLFFSYYYTGTKKRKQLCDWSEAKGKKIVIYTCGNYWWRERYTRTYTHKEWPVTSNEGTDGMANQSDKLLPTESSGQRSKNFSIINYFFFLSSSSPNYLLISSSIEYQLLCHGRPRRRSVSVWWDTARAKNGSSKNQFGIEYSMKLFSPALIQKTWDSRRRLNCQLAIQWPASTNSTNLQSRPDRRCGVYKRHPLVCWSVKESPDGEDCDVVPLTSQ